LYIDGAWIDAQGGDTVQIINPATEQPVGQITLATAIDVDRAVESARRAFRSFSRSSHSGMTNLRERKPE
jgi:aldehyde dehydrogenase (NAD+)